MGVEVGGENAEVTGGGAISILTLKKLRMLFTWSFSPWNKINGSDDHSLSDNFASEILCKIHLNTCSVQFYMPNMSVNISLWIYINFKLNSLNQM